MPVILWFLGVPLTLVLVLWLLGVVWLHRTCARARHGRPRRATPFACLGESPTGTRPAKALSISCWGAHRFAKRGAGRKEYIVRYMFAWLLGVPGIVIIAWYLLAHS